MTFFSSQKLISDIIRLYLDNQALLQCKCIQSLCFSTETNSRKPGIQTKSSPSTVQPAPTRETVVRVVPKFPRQKIDYDATYVDNIFVTPLRAMREYLLTPAHLESIHSYERRSPYSHLDTKSVTVYTRSDVRKKAIEIWGSMENLQAQRRKRRLSRLYQRSEDDMWLEFFKAVREKKQKTKIPSYVTRKEETFFQTFSSGPGRVVVWAVLVNAFNCGLKGVAFLASNSHSMFAEFLHSLADTINQMVLGWGIRQSVKRPDTEHPYGYTNARYITSLISGMGILALGSGVSIYRGVHALLYPEPVTCLAWTLCLLSCSFVSESYSLFVAYQEARRQAKSRNMPIFRYINEGLEPTINVVLLEDMAAVGGIFIAAACIGMSLVTGTVTYDALGSIAIGGLLGFIALKIVSSNVNALLVRSIPADKELEIRSSLENDRMIRSVLDIKATDIGGRYVRFKAEADFDGREITRHYLELQNPDKLLEELNGIRTIEDVNRFFLKHGERIIDLLGAEIDRIEKRIKKKHPEVRHIDIEVL